MPSTITILGPNGHAGHAAAKAFAAAGWQVTGFGRANRKSLKGVAFIAGDAADTAQVKAAIETSDVVFNGLNLPYQKWFGGAAEAQLEAVLTALKGSGKTLLFPGNVYNYAASARVIAPDTPQHPETPRGAVRMRMERRLRQAAETEGFQAIVLRAGDFYGPGSDNDWFDLMILREVAKGRIALPTRKPVRHAWAYLPDLADAFVALAERRSELGLHESFHFAGHAVTADDLYAAIENTAGRSLKRTDFPWRMLGAIGLAMPMIREVVKMRYLWDNEMVLTDPWLAAILGEDFGTPFTAAIAATVAPVFTQIRAAA